MSSSRTTRRRFLQSAVAGAAALSLSGYGAQAAGGRVLVIGAGLAGLVAANRLVAAGREVLLLEARAQPGGRVRTVRFADGLQGELGAARIAEAHSATRRWIAELGLTLMPFMPSTPPPLLVLDGRRAPANAPERLGLDLRPAERGRSTGALLQLYLGDLPPDLGDPDAPAESYGAWSALDAMDWPSFLAARGASPDAVRLLTLGADAQAVSALYVLRQIALHRGPQRYAKLAGGMDLLPRRLAARLGDRLRYGHRLLAIESQGQRLRVTCRVAGAVQPFLAEQLLLALPFSALRRTSLSLPLSAEKRAAIAGLGYFPSVRLLLPTAQPFWRAAGESGAARSDRPAEIWDAGYGQEAAGGLLSVTLGGDIGAALSGLGEADGLAIGRAAVADCFDGTGALSHGGRLQRWALDPLAGGGFAHFRPGDLTRFMPALARREGRLHFAGEHCDAFTGWMEGAVRSGERAAREILAG